MPDRLHRIVSQIKPRLIIILLVLMGGALILYLNQGGEGKSPNQQTESLAPEGLKNFVTHSQKRDLPALKLQFEDGQNGGLERFEGEVLVLN